MWQVQIVVRTVTNHRNGWSDFRSYMTAQSWYEHPAARTCGVSHHSTTRLKIRSSRSCLCIANPILERASANAFDPDSSAADGASCAAS